MSFTYDDGATPELLTRVAQGYIDLLAPLLWNDGDVLGERGPYLRTLRQLPVPPSEEMVQSERAYELLGDMPAVYVVLRRMTPRAKLPNQITWDMAVGVYAASGWAGNLVDGRLRTDVNATGDDPGVYTIVQHAIEYLHNRNIATIAATPIKIGEVGHLGTTPSYTFWEIETELEVRQCVQLDRDAMPLDVIETSHGVDEVGTIAAQRRDLITF